MNKICPNIQAGINEMGSRLSQVFFFLIHLVLGMPQPELYS